MAAQPIPQPQKAKKAKLAAVPSRQKPLYDSSLDRQAVCARLLDPRRTFGRNLTMFYAHAGRISSGAAQLILLVGIFRRTIEGSRPRNGKAPEWTSPMLPTDFARETGFTEQMMREALRDALKRGLIARKGDSGPDAHTYKLSMEAWENLPNAFELRPSGCGKDGEEEEKPHETVVSRVSLAAGRSARVRAGDMAFRCTNELLQAVDIAPSVSHGEVELKLLPAKASEERPVEESGSAPPPAAVVSTALSAVVSCSPGVGASEKPPKSKPGPAAPQAHPSAPALVGVAAHQIQECMAELRAPIMVAEARDIAGILRTGEDWVDTAWFCTLVRQRADRDARKKQALTFPVLKLIAQDAARELWPQEAARRAKGGSPEAPVSPGESISQKLAGLRKAGKLR